MLEGAVVLTMGVQIKSISEDVETEHAGVGFAVPVAVDALALTVLVRALYVAPPPGRDGARDRPVRQRITMGLANIQYFLREPLGWREGTAVVWAGMRGAVTVAAAQTLPSDTPRRPVLVLIAFAVAALSLAGAGRHDRAVAAPDLAAGRLGGRGRAAEGGDGRDLRADGAVRFAPGSALISGADPGANHVVLSSLVEGGR